MSMGIIGSVNDWLIVMQNRVYSILLYEGLIETLYTVCKVPVASLQHQPQKMQMLWRKPTPIMMLYSYVSFHEHFDGFISTWSSPVMRMDNLSKEANLCIRGELHASYVISPYGGTAVHFLLPIQSCETHSDAGQCAVLLWRREKGREMLRERAEREREKGGKR